MKNDLKILYKYLMLQFQPNRMVWYHEYVEMVKSIESVRSNLTKNTESKITDTEVFESSIFKNWEGFVDRVFANTGNGISSNGQSVFSYEMKNKALKDDKFISNLTQLILEPSKNNLTAFSKGWKELFVKNNPVQTNRAAAACTLELSSTVDEGKFNTIFSWFTKNNYIEKYTGENNWFDKNKYLVKKLREGLIESDFSTDDLSKFKIDDYWINIFVWLAFENIANPFSLSKQIIKYGAPGTGKTYSAKQICELQFELWKNTIGKTSQLTFMHVFDVVQFHPTYSYEDFVEGLRPELKDDKTSLRLKNGIFKQICKKAGKWEIDLYGLNPEKKVSQWTLGEIINSNAPFLNENHWLFVDGLDSNLTIGEFLPPYFILIDEINRAELSSVFGELMYSLEYRGAENAIKTQYSELNNSKTSLLQSGEDYKFFVPNNLYVIGTMNTIDRSVDSFDFALRRRFRWEEVNPDMDLLRMHLTENYIQWKDLTNVVINLNKQIEDEPLLGKDYRLGHAYFWDLKYSKDLTIKQLKNQIWDDRLGSLIEEYLRGSGRPDLIERFKNTFLK